MERKPFNVTLIVQPGYVHSLALKEAADYLHATITACGYKSMRTINHLSKETYNIILCAHMLVREDISEIPPDTIIFNSEQLEDADGWQFESGVYQEILNRFFIWDYSPSNLSKIRHENKCLIPFLYCRKLLRTDISREKGRSLLFYGALTPRREMILDSLKVGGVPVEVLFGQYDFQRDRQMLRSWAVLNLHKEDVALAFEPIRCFYPLINGVPVISEDVDDPSAEAFRKSIFFFDKASLIDGVRNLYGNPKWFADKSREMLRAFQQTSALPDVAAAIESFLSR